MGGMAFGIGEHVDRRQVDGRGVRADVEFRCSVSVVDSGHPRPKSTTIMKQPYAVVDSAKTQPFHDPGVLEGSGDANATGS